MVISPFLRGVAIVQVLSLAFCVQTHAEGIEKQPGPVAPTCHGVSLPESLTGYLVEKLPKYRPVSQEDYRAGRFDSEHPDYCEEIHWIVKADFDGNGLDDYAFLMVGHVKWKRHITLVAARAVKGGWSHKVLKSYASDREVSDTLVLEPAGEVFMGFNKDWVEKMASLAYPSVAIGGLEQCLSDRYYWKRGRWRNAYIRL